MSKSVLYLRHFGFRIINGTAYGTVGDGTTESTLNLGSASGINNASGIALSAYFKAGVGVEFFINKVSKGTITTNLPTGTTSAERLIDIALQNSAAVDKYIRFSMVDFWQAT